MKVIKQILPRAIGLFLVFTLICGVLYTGAVTVVAQVFFPTQANGNIIEVEGVKYGSALLGQHYTEDTHMWGRIMSLDVTTYQDKNGNTLLYSAPQNLSPVSEEYAQLLKQRVEKIEKSHPDREGTTIPVDLVTCSGSGLDPHISPAAAEYQVTRIAKAQGIGEEDVRGIIEQCTNGRLLGVFGEETVNVLKVNLMLDGIL